MVTVGAAAVFAIVVIVLVGVAAAPTVTIKKTAYVK
jgi:hypothetical protein